MSALRHLSLIISVSSKILENNNKIEKYLNPDEVSDGIKKRFSFCWYQFYKFIFAYYVRLKKLLPDYEVICVLGLVMANAATDKNFKLRDLTAKKWREEISSADSYGLNAMSISDITGIPRPTVVRKLKILTDRGWVSYNEKKLVTIDLTKETGAKGKQYQEKTLDMLSELILRILNQITIN